VLIGQTDPAYLQAAGRSENYAVNFALQPWSGVISQRYNTPELWPGFVHMAPPFLAYYAVQLPIPPFSASLSDNALSPDKFCRPIFSTTDSQKSVRVRGSIS
jgi:hypothetical protein